MVCIILPSSQLTVVNLLISISSSDKILVALFAVCCGYVALNRYLLKHFYYYLGDKLIVDITDNLAVTNQEIPTEILNMVLILFSGKEKTPKCF